MCISGNFADIISFRDLCRISLAHMDNPRIVDGGLNQMLSLIADHDSDTMLDVCNFCTDFRFIFELPFFFFLA